MTRSSLSVALLPRAALLGVTALVLLQPGAAEARVGVTSATNGEPLGKPPSDSERVLRIGIDVQANEVVTTRANDRAHLVFLDGTSLTVGPNAQLTIDKFVYDPATKTGDLAITASKGVFRLVGGKISKSSPIVINTPASTIGIRGGITIFTVTAVETTATFVFGDRMTVTGQNGQTQTATRPGTSVTTVNGGTVGAPTLVAKGALISSLGALEGSGQGSGGPGTGQTPGQPAASNADQLAAQNFASSNSGQGTGGATPPAGNSGPTTGGNPNTTNNTITNATTAKNTESATTPAATTTTTTTTTSTSPPTVIVTKGRFLGDPTITSFNNQTLAAPRHPIGNQALQPTGTKSTTTVTTTTTQSGNSTSTSTSNTTATIAIANGDQLVVPWRPGATFEFAGMTTGGGAAVGRGLVSPAGDFFMYVLTDVNNRKFGVFGGTPTSTFPTSGFAEHRLSNASDNGNLPFANPLVGGDAALKNAATVSNLYSVYSRHLSADLPAGVNINQGAASFQVSISIAGNGAAQKSYMGAFIGDYFKDYNSNSTFNSGGFVGSYRLGSSQPIGRLSSAISTADTGSGNAIYGPNADYMVYMNDQTRTTTSGTTGTTVRTPQAAFHQPYDNLQGEPYITVSAALKNQSTTLGSTPRTTQTTHGFVGGLVEARDVAGNFSSRIVSNDTPDKVSISTDAGTNRAAATIVLDNFGAPGATATFELGGTTGPRGARSVFIDDKIYGVFDQTSGSRMAKVSLDGTATPIASRTVLVSDGAAPVPQFFAAQGVTPCACEFLNYGWWSGDIRYDNPAYRPGERDRLNLVSYVTGTMTTVAQMNAQTGSATYRGDFRGNVQHGNNAYTGAGIYVGTWDFGLRAGTVSGSFDGLGISGNTTIVNSGPGFTGPLAVSGLASGSGSINGAFFSSPTNPTAYQAGNFNINGTRLNSSVAAPYTAAGTFKGQK